MALKNSTRKIINDPVWGFIELESELIIDLIDHPFFQRLRRIRQLGLSSMVYPGANHSRFEHAIGAMHLVRLALDVIRNKGHEISDEEYEGTLIAILLHDIGHGPFSHALEESIVQGISHELVSALLMKELNTQFGGRLTVAISIFSGEYPKQFLHQLVSSQLDMDRLDFLKRDSFYSGVSEGVVSSDRIIKMLNVRNDHLVVEAKGVYSIEKFLIARRLMYWQVYLHKTVLSAEHMMISVLRRACELAAGGDPLFATPALSLFLKREVNGSHFKSYDADQRSRALGQFVLLDDTDVLCAIKQWTKHADFVLSTLSHNIVNRKLFKVKVRNRPVSQKKLNVMKDLALEKLPITEAEVGYFIIAGEACNNAYTHSDDRINILYKNGKLKDIEKASDINLSGLSRTVRKHFICYPDEILLR